MTPNSLPSLLAAEPPEMVLVPREPTPEMLDALARGCGCIFDASAGYTAMLAAAPAASPPAAPQPDLHAAILALPMPEIHPFTIADHAAGFRKGFDAARHAAAELAAAPNSPKEAPEFDEWRKEAERLTFRYASAFSARNHAIYGREEISDATSANLQKAMETRREELFAHLRAHPALPKEAPQEVERTDIEWLRLPEIMAKFLSYYDAPTDQSALRIIDACRGRFAGKTIPATSKEQQ